MEITSIIIKRINKEGNLKALATITIDNAIAIHNIKIIEGKNGLFIAMPSRKSDQGFIDFVHPINTETRNMMQNAILAEFDKGENQNNE
ncbi:MAG: septation regulator SpoVG [Pseudobutyrivibrio sp.]|nr:septation regulator SpoVG [Pseudobutyrivibrio sp.]